MAPKWRYKVWLGVISLLAVVVASTPALAATKIRLGTLALEPGMMELEKQLEAAYEATHRGVDVELVPMDLGDYTADLQKMLTGPTPPDVLLVDTAMVQRLAASGILLELWPYIQRDSTLRRNLDRVSATVRSAFQYRNGMYAVPRSVECVGLVFNVDQFKLAGLQEPAQMGRRWDWNAFTTYAARLSRPTESRFGMNFIHSWANGFWVGFVLSNGGKVFTADGARAELTDMASMAAFELIADMGRNGMAATPNDLRRIRNDLPFLDGRASMMLMYPFGIGAVKRHSDFTMRVAPLPASPYTGKSVSPIAALGMAVVARSPQRQAAVQLALWFLSNEAQQLLARTGQVIPAREDYWSIAMEAGSRVKDGIPNMDVYFEQFRTGVPDPVSPYADSYTLFHVVNQALGNAMNGTIAVETAIRMAESQVNQLLAAGRR
jgi:multiple sugar transport system substrate-binding protein